MGTLIYYAAGNEEKQQRMKALAAAKRFGFREVYPLQTGQQIGFLAGIPGYREKKLSLLEMPVRIDEEMLILHEFAGKNLDSLLAALREEKLAVPLKAVVTQHNVGWTMAALYAELANERAKMEKQAKEK